MHLPLKRFAVISQFGDDTRYGSMHLRNLISAVAVILDHEGRAHARENHNQFTGQPPNSLPPALLLLKVRHRFRCLKSEP